MLKWRNIGMMTAGRFNFREWQCNKRLLKWLQIFIHTLIFLSVITFTISTLPDLSADSKKYLFYFEVFSTLIFTVEYIIRLLVAKKKIDYIFSFGAIVDFLAILPFYLGNAFDLRFIRVFRLFRLLKILKIEKFNTALLRLRSALGDVKEELIVYFVLTSFFIYLAAVGIYFCEHSAQPEQFSSVFHSMWWATVTLTTVGYGDVYPITLGGRVFTFVLLLLGLGLVSIPSGIIASAISQSNKKDK